MLTLKNFRLFFTDLARDFAVSDDALVNDPLPQIGPSQPYVQGFVPALGDGPIDSENAVLYIDGQRQFMRHGLTKRTVPPSAIDEGLSRRITNLMAVTGEPPSKKLRRSMRDEVEVDLLPRAFPKTNTIGVLLDVGRQRLLCGSTTESRCMEARLSLQASTEDELTGQFTHGLVGVNAARACPNFSEKLTDLVRQVNNGSIEELDIAGLAFNGVLWLESPENGEQSWKSGESEIDSPEVTDMLDKGMLVTRIGLRSKYLTFTVDDALVFRQVDRTEELSARLEQETQELELAQDGYDRYCAEQEILRIGAAVDALLLIFEDEIAAFRAEQNKVAGDA